MVKETTKVGFTNQRKEEANIWDKVYVKVKKYINKKHLDDYVNFSDERIENNTESCLYINNKKKYQNLDIVNWE